MGARVARIPRPLIRPGRRHLLQLGQSLPILLILAVLGACPQWSQAQSAATQMTYLGGHPHSALEMAGVQAGDVLLSWQAGDVGDTIGSIWGLRAAWLEYSHCDCFKIRGERATRPISWQLADGVLGANLLPEAQQSAAATRGMQSASAQDWVGAISAFEEITNSQSGSNPTRWEWLQLRYAYALAHGGYYARARAVAQQVASAFEQRSWRDPRQRIAANLSLAAVMRASSDYEHSVELLNQLLDEATPHRIVIAEHLQLALADTHLAANDLTAATAVLNPAHRRVQRNMPGSYLATGIQSRLARADFARGALDEAAQRADVALAAFQEGLGSRRDLVRALTLKGRIAQERGDLETAWQQFQQAENLVQDLGPDTMVLATTWLNAGVVAKLRGNLELADDLYLRSLRIHEAKAPGTKSHALVLNNMASIANQRYDLALAESYFQQSMAILDRVDKGGSDAAMARMNLGVIAARTGRMEQALALYTASYEIRSKIAPQSLNTAQSLSNMGAALSDLGRLEEADETYGRAMSIMRDSAPHGLHIAHGLFARAFLAYKMKDYDRALKMAHESLDIRQARIPESVRTAQVQSRLAQYYDAAGEADQALFYACAAADTLDKQKRRLGGTQSSQASFSRQYSQFYGNCMNRQIQAGDAEQAFAYSENYRAYFMLRMLSERTLDLDMDGSTEVSQQYREMGDRYNSLTRERAFLGLDATKEQSTAIDLQLQDTDARMAVLRKRLRQDHPRLAQLRYPQTVSAEQLAGILGEGTAALSYIVTSDAVLLFFIGAPSAEAVQAIKINVSRDDLETLVADASAGFATSGGAFQEPARRLFKLLLEPVWAELKHAEGILVMTDGPLNVLPFAALVSNADEVDRFVIQDLVVSYALSATVFAGGHVEGGSTDVQLVGFGDPVYAQAANSAQITQSRQGELTRLPETRREVSGIAQLFGKPSYAYLADEATEANIRARTSNARILHIAAHGVYDPKYPLDSAIALTGGNELLPHNDGFLRVWEIFEDLRLNADLVTLSACETAAGLDSAGEGLIGMQRSFQYAGAKSVLASVWNVPDRTTSALMLEFYSSHLKGHSWAKALQLAQISLLTDATSRDDSTQRGIGGVVSSSTRHPGTHPSAWGAWRLTRQRN